MTDEINFQTPTLPSVLQDPGLTWSASEYVGHEKSRQWYINLTIVTGIGAAFIYPITRDIFSSFIAILFGAIFGVIAKKPPKAMKYSIGVGFIRLGPKTFHFSEFKSFSITEEGAFSSVTLHPLKRFATLKTIYYPPENEDQIVKTIGDYLPFEQHQPDLIDQLMRAIRF